MASAIKLLCDASYESHFGLYRWDCDTENPIMFQIAGTFRFYGYWMMSLEEYIQFIVNFKEFATESSNKILLSGLLFDLIGIAFLTFDFLRLQRAQKRDAKTVLKNLQVAEREYADFETWREHARDPTNGLMRWGAEDDTKADRQIEENRLLLEETRTDITQAIEHMHNMFSILKQQANHQNHEASRSYKISIWGSILVGIGFLLQIIGTLLV